MHAIEHLTLIWAGVFVAVFLARLTRLTPVLYYLAVGCLFVNIGLLPKEESDFIRGFSDVGIVLIMFALGFEENASHFLASIKRSWGIAFFGAVAPFLAAFGSVWFFTHNFNVALISGLAMTATAVSLTMVSLKSEGLSQTEAATGIMTSAILDDIASLALVAILIPVAAGDTAPSLLELAAIVGKAILFFLLVVVIAVWVLPHQIAGLWRGLRFLDRWGIKQLLSYDSGQHAVLAVLLFAALLGLAAHVLGFHPAVGAYMAGLILKEDYFEGKGAPGQQEFQRVGRIVENVAFSWIGPVFFVSLGTKIVLDWDLLVSVIPEVAILTAAVFLAQIFSAGIAARYTGAFPWRDSVMIGFGMLGRAELCFVVLDIAYVQSNIISTEVFYILMLTAFWLNVAVPVTISWWKPYYTGEKPLGGKA
ncbi:MAG: cation:proton antiporter [Hyphomonas sp.]|uniref:cation:proton antiporter n=1 Tax=Hyphomonas sp. TaxID=87 RepID=UPI00352740E0